MPNKLNDIYDMTDDMDMSQGIGSNRGFAAMKRRDPDKQRKIAAKGGRAAHRKGTAHEWDTNEAKRAGSLGGRSKSGQS